jgi:hypothetical protein
MNFDESELRNWINLLAHLHLTTCRCLRTVGDEVAIFAEYVCGFLSDWLQTGRLYEGGPGQAVKRILDIAIQSAWACMRRTCWDWSTRTSSRRMFWSSKNGHAVKPSLLTPRIHWG